MSLNPQPQDSILAAPVTAGVALGSNLGDSQTILQQAVVSLQCTPGITVGARSRWYQTVPVGGPPQPDYLNGCLLLQVTLSPGLLLQQLLAIERQLGRLRQERWGPRHLDLDLLFYDNWVLDQPDLQLPHPRMRDRAFVLVPLAEIAADWVDPVSGQSVRSLLQALDCTGVRPLHSSSLYPD